VPEVIFSNIQSSSTSNVPGIPGLKFSETTQTVFQTPHGSPNGDRWIVAALASGGIVIVGEGTDGNAAFAVARRQDPTFFDPEVTFLTFRADMGITDDGSFAFAADTSAPTNSDEIVARWTPAAGFELIAREGVQAVDEPPGIGYGTVAGDLHMLNDQRVAFRSGGLTDSGGADAVFVNSGIDAGSRLLRSGVTIPAQQVGGAQHAADFPASFRIDASGANYMYSTDLIGAGTVVTVNNVVVAQNNLPLPGGYPGVFYHPDISDCGACLSPYNGHYAFHAPADLGAGPQDDVVIVDGRVVARTGQPIVPGSAECWDDSYRADTFFTSVVNSYGDYVIGGFTSTEGGFMRVFVFNGQVELMRSHTPVDLDGDGLANEGRFVTNLGLDTSLLTDVGVLYFVSDVGGGDLGDEAFMWTRVPRAGDINCDGRIDFFDIDPFVMALFDEPGYAAAYPDCWRITADITRDGLVDFFDIDPCIACLLGACP
jgi:hypothetical protein